MFLRSELRMMVSFWRLIRLLTLQKVLLRSSLSVKGFNVPAEHETLILTCFTIIDLDVVEMCKNLAHTSALLSSATLRNFPSEVPGNKYRYLSMLWFCFVV